MNKETNKMSVPSQIKITIIVLALLLVVSVCAIVARIVYLRFFVEQKDTAVVQDNVIGEGPASHADENPEAMIVPVVDALKDDVPLPAPDDTTTPLITTPSGEIVYDAKISLYKGKPSDNERFNVKNMLPGDRVEQFYQVKVSHQGEVVVYFDAIVTDQTKALGDALMIKITHLESGNVLYEGAFNKMVEGSYSVTFPQSATNETTAYYKIEAYLPTSTGNEHQAAMLKANFKWYVKDTGPLIPPPTGDATTVIVVVAVIALILLLVILVFRKKQKREEDDEYAE